MRFGRTRMTRPRRRQGRNSRLRRNGRAASTPPEALALHPARPLARHRKLRPARPLVQAALAASLGPNPERQNQRVRPCPSRISPAMAFFPGLWATIRTLLTKPGEFFRAMPWPTAWPNRSSFTCCWPSSWWPASMSGAWRASEPRPSILAAQSLCKWGLEQSGAAPVLLLVVYPLLLVLRLMLMTGVVHLLLRLLRSGGAGAEATFRVLCYSAAPLALGIFPVLGPLVGGIWSIVLTRSSASRLSTAPAWPPPCSPCSCPSCCCCRARRPDAGPGSGGVRPWAASVPCCTG